MAQVDTTLTIDVVEFSSKKVQNDGRGSAFVELLAADKRQYTGNTLTDILQEKGNIFIKSYGTTGLATISMRGSGANHTAVLWNGVNLQSPMNGTVDFNLVPAFLLGDLQIQKGGSSARYGSGAIGGSLHLQSFEKPKLGWHGQLGGTVGSFGQLEEFAQLSFAHKNWSTSTKIIHRQSTNDFKLPKNPSKRQENAAFSQIGLTNDNFFKINEKQSLRTYLWWQKTEREIPPTRGEARSDAEQKDDAFRVGVDWNRVGAESATKAKITFLQDELFFTTPVIGEANSKTRMYVAELEQDLFFEENQTLRLGLQHHLRTADADGFDRFQNQHRTAFWGSFQHSFWNEKLHWVITLRQELVDGDFIPFTGSTGANLKLNDWLNCRMKVAKNYNLPTFNDLFWTGSGGEGNINLQPEEGWSQEMGFDLSKKIKKTLLTIQLTAYNSTLANWILWQPDLGNIWRPKNERKVWSRGIEGKVTAQRAWKNWQFSTQMDYSYTLSTIQKIDSGDDPRQLGKQLPYVPVQQASFQLKIKRKKAFLCYQNQWVGQRETTSDNSSAESLAGYQVAQLIVGSDFLWKQKQLSVQLRINNLWREDYEVVAFRPMAGRGFDLTLNGRF